MKKYLCILLIFLPLAIIHDNNPDIHKTSSIKSSPEGMLMVQPPSDRVIRAGFFTTKPTGQGTGLGLSLSYDIVTKGHGGELKVETKEGEGTTFTIQIRAKDV